MDASFIQANSKPKKDANKQSDYDAEWGHKGSGYSATLNADRKTKLIRRVNARMTLNNGYLFSLAMKKVAI